MRQRTEVSFIQRRTSKVKGAVKSQKSRNPSQLCHWEARRPSTHAQPCWKAHGTDSWPGSTTGDGDREQERCLGRSEDRLLTQEGACHPELNPPSRSSQSHHVPNKQRLITHYLQMN